MIAAPSQTWRPPSVAHGMPPALEVTQIQLPQINDAGLDPRRVAAPPVEGSAAAKRDWQVVRDYVARRTPEGDAWAAAMDLAGTERLWRELATRTLGNEAHLQALIGATITLSRTTSATLKQRFQRERPFTIDPTLEIVGRRPTDPAYPSGHTMRSWAIARVIAAADPSLAPLAYQLAREVSISRVYGGVHFPSDVEAGARIGQWVGDQIIEQWHVDAASVAAA